jgi:hemin uptake protein HemP
VSPPDFNDAATEQRANPTAATLPQPASSAAGRTTHGPIPSEAVLRGQSTVEIEHNGHIYRLQTTRQGKLILTK